MSLKRDIQNMMTGAEQADCLDAFRRLWRAARTGERTSRLDADWEREVMLLIGASPPPRADVVQWLGQRFYPVALANAAALLLSLALAWRGAPDDTLFTLQDYILSYLPGYGLFL